MLYPNCLPYLSLWQIFWIASILSATISTYFYWFLGWLFRQSKNRAKKLAETEPLIEEGVELGKEIKKNYGAKLCDYYEKIVEWARSEDNKIVKRIKKGGLISILILSAIPEPGTRTVATVCARSWNSRTALALVIVGETFKNIYVLGLWSLVFWLFS